MKGLKGLIVFIAMCGSVGLRAQIWGSSEPPQKVDTIETSDFRRMDPVLISGSMDEERKKEYQILKRRVIKTMPYAKMAAMKMRSLASMRASARCSGASGTGRSSAKRSDAMLAPPLAMVDAIRVSLTASARTA